MDLRHLKQPIFLIDKRKVLRNVERMAKKASASGVNFRPHVKTHQSADVASWLRDYGVKSLTVSSVSMAGYFASGGWKDITFAVPVNIHQISAINDVARICSFHVIVDSVAASQKLVEGITQPLGVWIEMDTGYHRTGVPVEDKPSLVVIAKTISKNPSLKLRGILVHDGHTYSASGAEEVRAIFHKSLRSLAEALEALKGNGFPGLELSIGDTPTCSVLKRFPSPISEIRPGTFIFYDLTQAGVGACSINDIAAGVACPVISLHPERSEVILYGGSVHISKESIQNRHGSNSYGRVCRLTEKNTGWSDPIPGVSVVSLSQEHGIIRGPSSFVESVKIGDTLVVLPVHTCLTANLHGEFEVLGEGTISKFRL